MHRPGRFEPTFDANEPLLRGHTASPGEPPVGRIETVYASSGGAEQGHAFVDSWRRIYPTVGRERPNRLAGRRVEGIHAVPVDNRYEDHPAGRGRGANPPVEFCRPTLGEIG